MHLIDSEECDLFCRLLAQISTRLDSSSPARRPDRKISDPGSAGIGWHGRKELDDSGYSLGGEVRLSAYWRRQT